MLCACLHGGQPAACHVTLRAVVVLKLRKHSCCRGLRLTGRLDSFFTIKPAEPGTKRKEPPTKGKAGAKAAKTGKKGGVGAGKKK
jgi:hypothetical protein